MGMRKQHSHSLWECYPIFPSVTQAVLTKQGSPASYPERFLMDSIPPMKVTAVQWYNVRDVWGRSAYPGYLWDAVEFRIRVISNTTSLKLHFLQILHSYQEINPS